MSRVLAIHRYFWPDTPPYASLLRAIATQWTEDGHRVDVLTGQPSYKPGRSDAPQPAVERLDAITVRRIPMRPDRTSRWRRMFNVVWFPVAVGVRVLAGPRYDVVMCSTAPPVLLGWVVSLAARLRRARFVYHCMDIHPEIGRLSGDFARPWLYAALARLDLATCRRSAAIVVLSTDMRAALASRDPGLADRIVIVTNFELPDYQPGGETVTPPPKDLDRLRIVFTGNLGRFQGLPTLVRAVLADDPHADRIDLVFMGDGAVRSDLESLVAKAPPARRRRVTFIEHGTPAAVQRLLATADLGLVSLTPDVIRYAYPSKTATYLAAGVPVLAAVEPDSSLARLVVADRIGGPLSLTDETTTLQTLSEWVERRADLPQMSRRARAVWQRDYASDTLLPRWSTLLADVAAGRRVAV